MRRMALLALLWAWAPWEGDAATNVVRMGVPWSPGSKGMADLQAAGREIARQTAGRVQVKFAEGRDLESGPAPCDGALLVGSALTRRSPVAGIYSLPLLTRSPGESARLRSWLEAPVAAELEARGLSMIALLDLGSAFLHSKGPVETVAQWRAARLWAPTEDPDALRMAEADGLAPGPLGASQVRAAWRGGAVDAAVVPPLGAIVLQWHGEVGSVSEVPLAALCGAVALRTESLAGLEAADRAVLRDGLARAFAAAADELRRKEPEALDVLARNGVARHPLGSTPEQKAEWEAWAVAAADRLVAGGRIPGDALARARQALAEFRAGP